MQYSEALQFIDMVPPNTTESLATISVVAANRTSSNTAAVVAIDNVSNVDTCHSKVVTCTTASTKSPIELLLVPPPPIRPSSAYNIFFRIERQRIVNSNEDVQVLISIPYVYTSDEVHTFIQTQRAIQYKQRSQVVAVPTTTSDCSTSSNTIDANVQQTQIPKRKHVKTHGKIGFGDLARHIAKRWKELSTIERTVFTTAFKMEWEYYKTLLIEWKKSSASITNHNSSLSTVVSSKLIELQQQQQKQQGPRNVSKAKRNVQNVSAKSTHPNMEIDSTKADDVSIAQSQRSIISSSSCSDVSDMGVAIEDVAAAAATSTTIGITKLRDPHHQQTPLLYPSRCSIGMVEIVTPQTSNRSIIVDPFTCIYSNDNNDNERLMMTTGNMNDFYSDSNLLSRMKQMDDNVVVFPHPHAPFARLSSLPLSYNNNYDDDHSNKVAAAASLGTKRAIPAPSIIVPTSKSVVSATSTIEQQQRQLFDGTYNSDSINAKTIDDEDDDDVVDTDDDINLVCKQRQILQRVQQMQRMQKYIQLKQHILKQDLMIKKQQIILRELELQNESLLDSISMMDDDNTDTTTTINAITTKTNTTTNTGTRTCNNNNNTNYCNPTTRVSASSLPRQFHQQSGTVQQVNRNYCYSNEQEEEYDNDDDDQDMQYQGYNNNYVYNKWNTNNKNYSDNNALGEYHSTIMIPNGYEDIQAHVDETYENAMEQLGYGYYSNTTNRNT